MRTLILIISLFHASSFAAGVNCRSDDEPESYREKVSKLGESPLCGLSPDYSTAFRVVVIPSFDEATVATVYHRHDGSVDLNGAYLVSTDDFVRVVSEFKTLNIFDLDSHKSLVEKYCDFGEDPFHSELSRCPLGFDGAEVYLEAAYGGKKRVVLRWNGLSEAPATEKEFSRVATSLLSLGGRRELTRPGK